MKPTKTSYEEFGVIALCVLAIVIYFIGVLYSWNWTAFMTPILSALIIGGFLRIRTYQYLKSISGEYKQYDHIGNIFFDKKVHVVFSWRNLIRIRPTFLVNQVSGSNGNWESTLNISAQNPLLCSGLYKYTTSGVSGSVKGDWGLHELHMNPEDEIIHVKAVSKGRKRSDEYILKKVTNIKAI